MAVSNFENIVEECTKSPKLQANVSWGFFVSNDSIKTSVKTLRNIIANKANSNHETPLIGNAITIKITEDRRENQSLRILSNTKMVRKNCLEQKMRIK